MSLDPARPNIPKDGAFSPDGRTRTGAPSAGPPIGPGGHADGRKRRHVGRHRRAGRSRRRMVKRLMRFWPAAVRAVLLLIILATGTTGLAGPVGFGVQILLIVMDVRDGKGARSGGDG
jgi:hypothetical protein